MFITVVCGSGVPIIVAAFVVGIFTTVVVVHECINILAMDISDYKSQKRM